MSLDINSLEGNSHKDRNKKVETVNKERKRVKPVIDKSSVVSTKKPFSKKFKETFLTEDTKDVKSWLLVDVIIPGIKNTILSMLEMMFFGEVISRSRGKKRGGGYVDYSGSYSSYRYGSGKDRLPHRGHRDDYYDSDDRVDFRNIVLRSRGDAERVVEEMRHRIKMDESASVADLLDLIDVPGRYTDNNYGWIDERDIGIRRVSDGYLIDVSEPRYLN